MMNILAEIIGVFIGLIVLFVVDLTLTHTVINFFTDMPLVNSIVIVVAIYRLVLMIKKPTGRD